MADPQDVTPYSTLKNHIGVSPAWINAQAGERLAAYTAYHKMYWSEEDAFKLIRRNDDGAPVFVPKPKMIVDTTAHYLLKGMRVGVVDATTTNKDMQKSINDFCKRERFYSKFESAKLKGVVYGDWVMHITADPNKAEGSRISIDSVDPACYFPEYDTDDPEKRTGVQLIDHLTHPDDPSKTVIHVLRYWQEYDQVTGLRTSDLVWREEALLEMEEWEKNPKVVKVMLPAAALPPSITTIPVYHFKNAEWDGYEFGNSELKGYERIFQAIDQAISDEEISLALVGLGVYATDAGRPRDSQGREVDWVVAPGTVWEMPGATMVKRLEGISSVTPVLDHVGYLEDSLMAASGTSKVALGDVDVQTAESGIALALKFLPTLAKIEYRDTAGVEILTQMWYDWKFWAIAYDSSLGIKEDVDIVITLGEKLPLNRPKIIEELNNLLDRKIISRQFYRDRLNLVLEYDIPDDMEQKVIDEQVAMALAMLEVQVQQFGAEQPQGRPTPDERFSGPGGRKEGNGDTLPKPNNSNNRNRVNESNGTEVKS